MAGSVCFRADAATWMGIGHVMRCLTLADSLSARGHTCRFVCRTHAGNLIEYIRNRGYAVAELPGVQAVLPLSVRSGSDPEHAHWLGCDWDKDAVQTLAVLADKAVDWLIVDHYALEARWESKLRRVCPKILVIDDLADRSHTCDLLLDQTFGRRQLDYQSRLAPGTEILCGSLYALLRPEFARLRAVSLARRGGGAVRQLLISMGGVDQYNATGQILASLAVTRFLEPVRVIVVMGSKAPWLAEVRRQAEAMSVPVEVRVDVSDMAELMVASDLAIGAAGATSWERCCLGLPAIMVVLAGNQRAVAGGLKQAGAAEVIADIDQIAVCLPLLIEAFIAEPERLRIMSEQAARITDGGGAQRVADCLEASP